MKNNISPAPFLIPSWMLLGGLEIKIIHKDDTYTNSIEKIIIIWRIVEYE